MEVVPETKTEESDLPFSFDSFSSGAVFLCLLLMRLTPQNISAIGKITIASSMGYEALTTTSETSTV